MQFGMMEAQNLMSIESVEFDFRNRGLVLVQGINDDSDAFESNGAGKSTVVSEAVVWILFGETIRGQKGDKIINRRAKKNTSGILQILDNDDEYVVERYRKHKEHKNHVRLFRNGENITGKSDKDTDQMIIDLLQMDFATFINSIMFGQGVSKMFANSTDAEQKKILENMLQIDIYKACQDLAKKYAKDIESDMNKVQTQLDLKLNSKKTTEQSLALTQEKEAKLGEQVTKRIAELEKELETYNNMELPSTEELQDEYSSYVDLKGKIDTKLSQYKEHEDTLNDLVGEHKSLQRSMNTCTRDMDKKRQELADIKSGKNVPKTCRTCGQDLPLEDTTHIENHIKDAIKDLGMEWQGHKDELAEVEVLIGKVNKVLEGKKTLEEQRDQILENMSEVNSEIRTIDTKVGQINRMKTRIADQISEQVTLLGTTYAEIIEQTIQQLDEISVEIRSLQDELDKLGVEFELYNFWVNAYGNQGIKSMLLDSVTPFLNTRANYYLKKLADSSIEVIFNTQTETAKGEKRDKFSVDINNSNGDDDYKGNSNGEKRRIDVAINMALQDLVLSRSNKRLDLIVYDEVFEGLDAVGSESVIQLLKEKAQECGTILVITHNDSLKQLFSKSIIVRKEYGRTVIEDGE